MKNELQLHKSETGSPYYARHRIKDPQLLKKNKHLPYVYNAIDLVKKGMPRKAIFEELLAKHKAHSTIIYESINKAVKIVEYEYIKDHKSTMGLHFARYDEQIDELNDKTSQLDKRIEVAKQEREEELEEMLTSIRIARTMDLVETLQAKERLLQLHNPTTIINYNFVKYGSDFKEDRLNLKKLDDNELTEFLTLILKMKISNQNDKDIEEAKLVTSKNKEIDDIEEVEFTDVEILEGEKNIDKIKFKEEEISPYDAPKTFNALDDVKEKLKETLRLKVETLFKK